MSKPITPNEVPSYTIPDTVIDVFNDLIKKNMRAGIARVEQREVMSRLNELGLTPDDIFRAHMLDVEPFYQAAGWDVFYDKPAHFESYQPVFVFTKPEFVRR